MKKTEAVAKGLLSIRFITFLFFTLTLRESSASAIRRSSTENLHDGNISESPRICLEPPKNLPQCNFITEGDESSKDSLQNTRILRTVRSLDKLDDLSVTADQGSTPMVFTIERCIPPRLLSMFPICDEATLTASKGVHGSFLPFNIINTPENYKAPLEFPKFHTADWLEDVNIPYDRLIRTEKNIQKKNSYVHGDSAGRVTVKEQPTEIQLQRQNISKTMAVDNVLPTISSWSSAKNRDIEVNTQTLDKLVQKHGRLTNENTKEKTNDKRISHDFKVFQDAKPGSEFPYAQAIDYDPKKLEERKNEAGKRSFDSNTRGLNNLDERKSENFREFLFDTRRENVGYKEIPIVTEKSEIKKHEIPEMLSEFPYSIAVPFDASKLGHSGSSYDGEAVVKDKSEASLKIPKTVEKSVGSLTSDTSSMPKKREIPEMLSEFPYSIAVPFDPSKLGHSGSSYDGEAVVMDKSEASLKIPKTVEKSVGSLTSDTSSMPKKREIPEMLSEFPYSIAVPFDASKLGHSGSSYDGEAVVKDKSEVSLKIPKTVEKSVGSLTSGTSSMPKKREIPEMLSEFPYSIAVPFDASKLGHSGSSYDGEAVVMDKSEVSLKTPKTVEKSVESLRNDVSSMPKKHEIPEMMSEFPYSIAIPFDASKLGHSGSTHRQSSLTTKP